MPKIKTITVSNLKAVSSLTADFNGCTAIITGGNNKGKSSFLKSLPERLRGVKPSDILKHGEKEGFAEWILTSGEKFVWKFDGKKETLSFFTEKNIKTAVSKELCKAYFPPVFDVDEFLNSAPKKQKETLQKLTGIDFTEIDGQYKAAYDDRTYANKKVTELKARNLLVDPLIDDEEKPTADLEKELNGIEAHNLKYQTAEKEVAGTKSLIDDNDKEVAALRLKIQQLEERKAKLLESVKVSEDWLAIETNKPKTNEVELKGKIAKIKEENKEITENNKAKEHQIEVTKAEQTAADADAEVKRIEAEKLDVIKNASMPEGFGFSEDGITYQGFDFTKEQLSSSGIYIAALKLAAINLGEVRCLHFDASFLDKNSLSDIEKWAEENNLQLLIERPDFEGGEIEYKLIHENGQAT